MYHAGSNTRRIQTVPGATGPAAAIPTRAAAGFEHSAVRNSRFAVWVGRADGGTLATRQGLGTGPIVRSSFRCRTRKPNNRYQANGRKVQARLCKSSGNLGNDSSAGNSARTEKIEPPGRRTFQLSGGSLDPDHIRLRGGISAATDRARTSDGCVNANIFG